MPRFLNTWTGEFEWHPDPKKVTYAILSHVWRDPKDGGEQSYHDVLKIQAAVKRGRFKLSRAPDASLTKYRKRGTIFAYPGLSDKIKGFCKVARKAGFRLAWNDACCIDKTSSAELSEAINSMYEWYRLSDMCYVYLADVPDGDRPQEFGSKFQDSRWHRRGWTLQELIAPECLIFLTKTWRFLGSKMGLARTLENLTGINLDILTHRTTLDSISVAGRMSWAAKRYTTRVEDRAYSLMGIFDIHMSPIYGEGENAFLRLQEEIIRTIPDQSIFVWGDRLAPSPPHHGVPAEDAEDAQSAIRARVDALWLESDGRSTGANDRIVHSALRKCRTWTGICLR
ncbi:HET-domain-containing protein [Trametes versicolor FP-101664 SS1]|uniref:HET-domain-containing protein n=1 Tax=Trametes versicolor (strain FP-101664) TaxID=717944 RepID=R7S8H5_TRAVS|nr:HET-domain-containing protein [Trametes versicolor FP-101664 SS1]EIW51962.1 HET-domain-containing protein [Trametes versicolor FP-101664 SS1]